MALHPTTHAAYPKRETEQQRHAGEMHSITKCLLHNGFAAGVSEGDDGTLHIVIVQCLNAACTDVRTTVLSILCG